jgi:AraC-like DNA-binding protein
VKFDTHGEAFHINYSGGSIGNCNLHRGSHSAVSFSIETSNDVHFLIMQKGGLRFSGQGAEIDIPTERAMMLFPPISKGFVHSEAAVAGISLIISADALRLHMSKMAGESRAQGLDGRRPSLIDLADPVPGTLARNIVSVFHEMQRLGQAGLSSVACANFDELLLGMAAMAVSADTRRFFTDEGRAAGSSIVRRARDYLRTHAAEPLSLTDLAASLGVGLRALQISFRREMGCSPREYLMTCRLELARSRLLGAESDTKVAAVALECGFTDLALFSRKYRETFGELPSETLRGRV